MATKYLHALPILAALVPASSGAEGPASAGEIRRNGMVLQMRFRGDYLECRLSAPGTGWLAMGFNPGRGLTGTNLIMGRVRKGRVEISDRYIVRPGVHRSMEELGGKDRLMEKSGRREKSRGGALRTSIRFLIPLKGDGRHHDLVPGAAFEILLAYSMEDDFMHHSIMRTAVVARLPVREER